MHHIAWAKALKQAAHQSEFAAAFAAVRPYHPIKRRAAGKANHHPQTSRVQSATILADSMSFLHCTISLRISESNCSGEPLPGSAPIAAN